MRSGQTRVGEGWTDRDGCVGGGGGAGRGQWPVVELSGGVRETKELRVIAIRYAKR